MGNRGPTEPKNVVRLEPKDLNEKYLWILCKEFFPEEADRRQKEAEGGVSKEEAEETEKKIWRKLFLTEIYHTDLDKTMETTMTIKAEVALYDKEDCLFTSLVTDFGTSSRWCLTEEQATFEAVFDLIHKCKKHAGNKESDWRYLVH